MGKIIVRRFCGTFSNVRCYRYNSSLKLSAQPFFLEPWHTVGYLVQISTEFNSILPDFIVSEISSIHSIFVSNNVNVSVRVIVLHESGTIIGLYPVDLERTFVFGELG